MYELFVNPEVDRLLFNKGFRKGRDKIWSIQGLFKDRAENRVQFSVLRPDTETGLIVTKFRLPDTVFATCSAYGQSEDKAEMREFRVTEIADRYLIKTDKLDGNSQTLLNIDPPDHLQRSLTIAQRAHEMINIDGVHGIDVKMIHSQDRISPIRVGIPFVLERL
jgi:hypothetical protein